MIWTNLVTYIQDYCKRKLQRHPPCKSNLSSDHNSRVFLYLVPIAQWGTNWKNLESSKTTNSSIYMNVTPPRNLKAILSDRIQGIIRRSIHYQTFATISIPFMRGSWLGEATPIWPQHTFSFPSTQYQYKFIYAPIQSNNCILLIPTNKNSRILPNTILGPIPPFH